MFSQQRGLRLLLALAAFGCCSAISRTAQAATVAATMVATSAAAATSATTVKTQSEAERLLETLHYSVPGSPSSEGDLLTVVNLDLLEDDVIAGGVEGGVQDEFDDVDRGLGEDPSTSGSRDPLPAHRANRQLSLINQGVYVPDARFNAFVDGVMVNMVAEMRRRRMDPLYFRVHKGGRVQHVPTRRRTGKTEDSATLRQGRQQEDPEPEREAIGGGVIRGLTKIKRFGNGEVQVAGNSTLVRSHYVFGPLDIELVFETAKGPRLINSTLTALAGHGLAEVSAGASRFLDFIIDSPSDYEVKLRGHKKNKRLQRLSKAAIMRLVRREGRLEVRLMRMFERGGKKPLPDVSNGTSPIGLWPTNSGKNGDNETDVSGGNAPEQTTKRSSPSFDSVGVRKEGWQPEGLGPKKVYKNEGSKKTEAGFEMGSNQKKSKPPK